MSNSYNFVLEGVDQFSVSELAVMDNDFQVKVFRLILVSNTIDHIWIRNLVILLKAFTEFSI
jgi:hypothetical protein